MTTLAPISDAEFNEIETNYHAAARALSDALQRRITDAVRAAYPEATCLRARGEYGDEYAITLRAFAVTGALGQLVADGDDEDQDAATKFEKLADNLAPDLDRLAELNGEDYVGPFACEIDVPNPLDVNVEPL